MLKSVQTTFALACLLALIPQESRAYGINVQDLMSALGGGKRRATVCDQTPKTVEGMSADQMLAKGLELMRKPRVTCEAARYFSEIQRQHPHSSAYRKSRTYYIDALRRAGDYNGAINEANILIKELHGTGESELAHYFIVLSVRDQLNDPKNGQEWAEYALGFGDDQDPSSPFLMNLAFRTYLDKYPKSPRRAEVTGYLQQAKNNYAGQFLEVGLYYYKRGEYKAAIRRFLVITQNGPGNTSFEPALYYAAMSYRQLAAAVRSGKISDKRLNQLLEVDPEQPVTRQVVAAMADRSAHDIEMQMRTKIPNSPWTKKLSQ